MYYCLLVSVLTKCTGLGLRKVVIRLHLKIPVEAMVLTHTLPDGEPVEGGFHTEHLFSSSNRVWDGPVTLNLCWVIGSGERSL